TKYHKRIQRQAKSLYQILKEKLEYTVCECGALHSANLQLDLRVFDFEDNEQLPNAGFRFLFITENANRSLGMTISRDYILEAHEDDDDQSCWDDLNTASKCTVVRFNL